MLPLRLAVFAAVFGIALSGLFWLLGNLSEPELLRSKKAVVVKGCDPESMKNEDAARICPQLFCQKHLLDSRTFELRYRFDVTVDRRSGTEHLIGGAARPFVAKHGNGPDRAFACVLEQNNVVAGRDVTADELQRLANASTWRELLAETGTKN